MEYWRAGGGSSNSTPAAFDPTASTQEVSFFDDLLERLSSSSMGSMGLYGYASGTGANNLAYNFLAADNNRVGIYQVYAGTSASSYAGFASNITSFYLGQAKTSFSCAMKLATVPDGTNNSTIYFGFSFSFPAPNNYGIWLCFDRTLSTTNWQAKCSKSGVSTTVDTGVAADTSWHTFRIEINSAGTSVTFYIDGNLVATITTNLPTNLAMGPAMTTSMVSGTPYVVYLDWFYLKYTIASGRGTF